MERKDGKTLAKTASAASAFNIAAKAGKLALKAAGIWLWPFAARWNQPFSRLGLKKKTIRSLRAAAAFTAVVAVHQVTSAGTARLFPTGEEELQSRGVDPKLARELADTTIRVRHRDFWGTVHALNDLPTIFGLAQTLAVRLMPENAYAVPGWGEETDDNTFKSYLSGCSVLLQDDHATARDTIAALSGIPADKIENVPLSDRESFDAVMFHEFAHCHSKNSELEPPLSEADADVRGAFRAAQVHNNPEISKSILYARAMSRSPHGHDSALYLDASLKGAPLPQKAEAMLQQTADPFALADLHVRNVIGRSKVSTEDAATMDKIAWGQKEWRDILDTYNALRVIRTEYSGLLSRESMRRAELYIEAVEYFAPKAAQAEGEPAFLKAPVPAPAPK